MPIASRQKLICQSFLAIPPCFDDERRHGASEVHSELRVPVEAGQSLMSCSAPGRPLQRINSFRAVADDATLIEPVR